MPAAQPLTLSAAERWHMVQSVERGDAAQVMAMLELGFDPNMAYDPTDCRTLLSRAAVGKHAHIVRLLIEYGAEFDMERLGRDAASDANGQRGTNDAHGVNDDGGAELVAAALRGELDAARQQLIEECAAKEEQFGVLTSECASALEVSKHALEVALRKAAAATAQFERAGAEQARCRYCWRPATEAEPSASASANALVSADAEDAAAAAAAAAATAARDPFRPPRGGGVAPLHHGDTFPEKETADVNAAEGSVEAAKNAEVEASLNSFWDTDSTSEEEGVRQEGAEVVAAAVAVVAEGKEDMMLAVGAPRVATLRARGRSRGATQGTPKLSSVPRTQDNVAVVNPLTLDSEGKRRELMRHERFERMLLSPANSPGGAAAMQAAQAEQAAKRSLVFEAKVTAAASAPMPVPAPVPVPAPAPAPAPTAVSPSYSAAIEAKLASIEDKVSEIAAKVSPAAAALPSSDAAPLRAKVAAPKAVVMDDEHLADEIEHSYLPRLQKEFRALKAAGEMDAAIIIRRRYKALRATARLLSPPRTAAGGSRDAAVVPAAAAAAAKPAPSAQKMQLIRTKIDKLAKLYKVHKKKGDLVKAKRVRAKHALLAKHLKVMRRRARKGRGGKKQVIG